MADRIAIARACYEAFASNDRSVVERHMAEVLTFAGDRIRRVEVFFGWDL